MPRKAKITVLKTTLHQDLIAEYGTPGFGVCPVFKPGQTFICNADRPKGFCHEAWHVIYHYVFTYVYTTGDTDFGWNWMNRPNVAITSCNDGLRPVIFKIEPYTED